MWEVSSSAEDVGLGIIQDACSGCDLQVGQLRLLRLLELLWLSGGKNTTHLFSSIIATGAAAAGAAAAGAAAAGAVTLDGRLRGITLELRHFFFC